MKKLILYILFITPVIGFTQTNLKYSGFFDSYYTDGPIKFTVEPALTKMYGDLKKGGPGGGIGVGANYRILPPVYLSANFRYLTFSATDHDATRGETYSGNTMQINLLADYHFVYDLVRKQADRRRGKKFLNAYVSSGASLNKWNNDNGGKAYAFHLPLILGMPIRFTPKFTLVPEIGYFMSFSDAMDGVEGISANNNNDGYVVAAIKLMFSPFDKRRKPKPPRATNPGAGGGVGGGSGSDDFSDDDFGGDDDFEDDGFDSGFDNEIDMSPSQKIIDEPEEEVVEEENTEDEIIEDEYLEEIEEDGFDNETNEEEGPKYDEDGFLIDD